MARIEIGRAGTERLEEVGPIWRSLSDHHAEITPPGVPVRPSAEGWPTRRAGYARSLAGGATLLIADRAERPVGYAFAIPRAAPVNLAIERLLEVETVAVLPEARGAGIGGALMDAVRELAAELGIEHIQLSVRTANEGALRFYERQGFEPLYVTLLAWSLAAPAR
ncbi:MAG: GNAT family N-acetyltransferase [Solirubrobacterales bacterium]